MTEQTLSLAGLRVLEFTHTVMGPAAGLVLADAGADVIKIEPAPDGDPTRYLPGFGKGYYSFFNRNRRSLCVNLKSDAGREIALRLVQDADVMIENFAPATMQRLGLDYEKVSALNPRLIYCSLKGFTEGPYAHRTALDEVVQMMSGLAYMTGPPGMPLRAGASVIDILSGTFGAMGVLLALRERDATGKGKFIQNGLFETAAYLMGQHLAFAATETEPIPSFPGKPRAWAIYQPFASLEGDLIFIGVTSDKHWEQFCTLFNRPDLLADESLKTNTQRYQAFDRLIPDIAAMLAQLPKADIIAKCETGGFPFAPVNHPEDLFDDPHLNAGGHLLETEFVEGFTAKLPRLPIQNMHLPLRRQPPRIGEHTREILLEAGYVPAQIDELLAQGVIAIEERHAR